MFDINVAGFGQNAQDLAGKGSTVFADLEPLFQSRGGTLGDFLQWRHDNATPDKADYYGDGSKPGPDGAGLLEDPETIPPGQNRLLSRQELIATGDDANAGLTPDLAASLRTVSAVANRISAEDLFADGSGTPVRITDASLEATGDRGLEITRLDGSVETVAIKTGQPLFPLRFPLARLRWLADREADGTPKYPDLIKKYFGLQWDSGDRIFIYTSPDGNTAAPSIKTLAQLAAQINGGGDVREPDFFEWLKAAIDPDSLGQTGGSTNRIFPTTVVLDPDEDKGRGPDVPWETSKDLHLLRIGVNIVDQADPDSIATGIRSSFTGVDPDLFDSYGQENLPGINEVITAVLRDGNDLDGYLQFELWNPNRNATSGAIPPRDFAGGDLSDFRIRILSGQALMEPFVYMTSIGGKPELLIRNPSPASATGFPHGEEENSNNPWNSMKRIVEHSQTSLAVGDFTSSPLADRTISFSLGSTGAMFFDEPYLVNGALASNNSMDDTGRTTMTFASTKPAPFDVLLGAEPAPGSNSILLASVRAPNPCFSGLKPSDIYEADSLKGGLATDQPSGTKAWNAVQFHTQGSRYYVDLEPITFVIEAEAGGRWWPYQKFHNLDLGTRAVGSFGPQAANRIGPLGERPPTTEARWTYNDGPNDDFSRWTTAHSRRSYPNADPRTERFSLTDQVYSTPGLGIRPHTDAWDGSSGSNGGNLPHGLNTKPGTSYSSAPSANELPRANPAWTWTKTGTTNIAVLADLAMNTGAGGTFSYSDADTRRRGDAGWLGLDQHPALPVASYPGARDARPLILDRPFRSLGELGMVFRDIPWRSLDLFTANSPDRRLLDVFSIEDGPLAHGRINPNSASQETLRALVREAALDPSDPISPRVGEAVAHGVADMLAALDPSTPAGRISSLEDLARRLAEAPQAAPAENDPILSYKTKTENFLRALAPALDTRTWQLMADVVAQSGRLPSGKTDPGDFIVQGQRRFWVYLAIDRITGEIVHQHLEPIYE